MSQSLRNHQRTHTHTCILPVTHNKDSPLTQVDFEKVKDALSSTILLYHPVAGAPLVLTTDASDHALGASLEQVVNGERQPIALWSSKLNKNKLSYSTYDRELEAIYRSVKAFRHLLDGMTFEIHSDHKPLTFDFKQKPEKA